jgi:predicted RNA-binding Zn ribbon-like protein
MTTQTFDDLTRIGEHVALDFLNTIRQQRGHVEELLNSDADVLAWLKEFGFPVPAKAKALCRASPDLLANTARELREQHREWVARRKSMQRCNLALLNRLLRSGSSHSHIYWDESLASPQRSFRYVPETALDLLRPLAEAIADFLLTGNFDLVRKCEASDCVLIFLDTTKSHRRLWCSAAQCGNRAKVAAFRARSAQMLR